MKDCDILDILSNKKVLYAEDEEGIRRNISDILELFFYKVVSVSDGQEALDEMYASSYDVLIFDICMPHLDGLEAIKKIREKDKKIPIIILSAHTEQEYLWRAVELKITKYLTKPYDKEDFVNALKKASLEMVDGNVNIKLKNELTYNPCSKTISNQNENIQLTKNESRLLEYFLKRSGQSVTFDDISEYIWELETPSKEAIKSLIKDLRKKVGADLIKNIYGIGYMLEI